MVTIEELNAFERYRRQYPRTETRKKPPPRSFVVRDAVFTLIDDMTDGQDLYCPDDIPTDDYRRSHYAGCFSPSEERQIKKYCKQVSWQGSLSDLVRVALLRLVEG
jgi:hypothetical protein